MRRLACSAVAAALTGLVLVAPAAQARCAAFPDPEDPPVSIGVPTLALQLDPQRDAYRRGERVQLKADVRFGTVDGPKAVGAKVEIVVKQGDKVLTKLFGTTDGGGAAMIRFLVPRHWPTGAKVGEATAELEAVPGYDCRAPLVYHGGQRTVDPLFRVKG